MSFPHKEFAKNSLELEDINPNPFHQFSIWLDDYIQLDVNESISVNFSTIDRDGFPSSRIVYMRDINDKGLVFFTNYDSNKGEEIRKNKKASMLFYWPELERQVRVWGEIEKVEDEVSDNYFGERPKGSQAGAWVSRQSKEINDRKTLEKMHRTFLKSVGDKIIPRPKFWGGYQLIPNKFEFWQGRENRLHDRFLYTHNSGNWDIVRLAP